VDVAIQTGLGRFFASKLRASVLYAIYDRTGDATALEEACKAYGAARNTWARMARLAQGVYVSDITFGLEAQLRGHWLDRLGAIDEDMADMQKREGRPPEKQATAASESAVLQAVQIAFGQVERPVARVSHTPPSAFRPGQPVTIELTLPDPQPRVKTVRLVYRRVHQAQPYQTVDMQVQENRHHAAIPGQYSDSPYPLEYYFELYDGAGQAWLYPGFDATLANEPYFVVRQA
jgi:hypothetical protein